MSKMDLKMDQSTELNENIDITCKYFLAAIEIFNFKSYKGRHLVGPLTNLTAVIGPNGSGKSNLMDAISFALVIKSAKLRAKNVSKLINISSLDDSPTEAYVKLIFKSKLDFRILTFMRSIENNNLSKYYIDESMVTKEVYMKTLLELGFNAKNKIFLIFQGTIDTLITKNPTDFTAILEEISGSSEFKEDYDKLKALCSSKEKELHTLFTKKQSYIKSKQFITFLDKQHKQNSSLLLEIEETKCKLILLELKLTNNKINDSTGQLEESTKSIEVLKQEFNEIKEQKESTVKSIALFELEKCEKEKQYRDSEVNIICKSKLKLQMAKDKLFQIKNRLNNASKNEAKIKKEIDSNLKLIEQLKLEIASVEKQITEIKHKINDDSSELRISNKDFCEFNNLKKEFNSKIYSINEKYSSNENLLADLKFKQKLFQVKKENLENELISLNFIVDKSDIDSNIHVVSNELSELLLERENIKNQLNDAEVRLIQIKDDLSKCLEETKKRLVSSKRVELIDKEKEFISYLTQNYSGVHGRLSELCKPANKKYNVAISIVMQKYLNAIVVDSFKTVEACFKNEKSLFINSETFLALDIIKAPNIKSNLRNISTVPNVCLVYDLIRFTNPRIEKAVRFVVGNTLICENRKDASQVAYDLGDGNRYNAISIDGTFFQANGQISANFTHKNVKNSWNYSEYLEQVSRKNSLQKDFFNVKQEISNITSNLEDISIKIEHLESKLGVLTQAKIEASNKEIEKENARKIINEQLEKLNEQLHHLHSTISDNIQLSDEYQSLISDIEKQIFGLFLKRLDFTSVKQFETVYFNIFEDDLEYLNECEAKLKDLQNKLNVETDKKLVENLKKWNGIVQDETDRLKIAELQFESFLEKLETDEKNHNIIKISINEIVENLKNEQDRLKAFNKDLEKCQEKIKIVNKTIVMMKSSIDSLYEARHELYKKSFIEAIPLSFISNYESFQLIFGEISNLSRNEIYTNEDEIVLDYTLLGDLDKCTNKDDFLEIKHNLEQSLQRKEAEIQKLTLTNTSTTTKKDDLLQKIRLTNNSIENVRIELSQFNMQFEAVKKNRCQLFNSFLKNVSTNLDRFYKELMHSNASQAFLLAENTDEPYLGGIMFNCIVPGKIFQPISCLSGGEKTLAAFAFIFSSYFERLPAFFIMDEIDGCLDNTNIAKLIDFLKTKADQTQFILISLKPELFGQTNSLVGVCKNKTGESSFESKAFTLDLSKYPV